MKMWLELKLGSPKETNLFLAPRWPNGVLDANSRKMTQPRAAIVLQNKIPL
jgi:hypothetical protein